jgi:protein TonB
LSERLEEEWLADLEARTTPGSRLLLGLGCCWAAAVIVQENLAPGLTAAATTGNKVMSSYVRTDASLFSQRTTTLAVIIGLHVALVFAFATGLGSKVVAALPKASQAWLLPEVREPPPAPPTLTDPLLIRPRIHDDFPPPDFPIAVETGPDAIRDVVTTAELTRPVLPPPPQRIARVQGGPGKGFPNSEDYYPLSAKHLNESGTTVVNVCVDGSGHLTGAPTVTRSSGSPRLDDGAVKLARAGSGHYRATTQNGQPVDSCYPLGITFKLRD